MSKFSTIKKYKKENDLRFCSLFVYIKFLKARLVYKIGVDTFLKNKLFDKSINHEQFYSTLHTYIHKWKYSSKKFAAEKSKKWLFLHHFQYFVFKILYPGLDAMDYFRYQFYELKHKNRKTFITEGFLKKMNRHFNPINEQSKEFYKILDDKEKFNSFYSGMIKRDWIKINNNFEEFYNFAQKHNVIVIKPVNGGGGSGIEKLSIKGEDLKSIYERIKQKNFIVEEAISQSSQINLLNKNSINTVRIYSVLSNDKIVVAGATMRFGKCSSSVDNYSKGNYAASVNVENGEINSEAVTQEGERIEFIPETKQQLIGFKIPSWNSALSTVIEAHKKIKYLRYIGWDIAFNSKNEPVLIEGNTFAGVELQQHPSLQGKKPIYKKYW